jgi:hypothetical protein
MTNQEAFGSGVNLKEFFEASTNAIQIDSPVAATSSCAQRRQSALVPRGVRGEIHNRRAVTDAAKALSALWNMPNLTLSPSRKR